MSFVRPYNPSVRVANWLEDVALEQDKIKEFLRRKDNGDLKMSKTQAMMSSYLTPVELRPAADGYLHFGQTVLIRHCATNAALSGSISTYASQRPDTINATAAPEAPATVRSTFTIVPFEAKDKDSTGPVTYGDKFYLRHNSPDGSHWYLFTERVSLFGGGSKHDAKSQEVVLRPSNTGVGSYGTVWQFVYFNPQLRLEAEGHPVHANDQIIINSASTNQALAIVRKHFAFSEYGTEYAVTCHTHINSHKAEGPENHWVVEA